MSLNQINSKLIASSARFGVVLCLIFSCLGCGGDGSSTPAADADVSGADVVAAAEPATSCGEGCGQTGSFVIRWDGESEVNQIRIFHEDEPERVLWETSPGTPPVWAGRGEETVDYGRGSFQFEDEILQSCSDATFDEPALEGASVSFNGSFGDCDLNFNLSFTSVGSAHLGFNLKLDGDEAFNRLSLSYASSKDEGFYGFGAQYNYLNLKGRRLPIWCQEQGHGRGLKPLSSVLNLTEGNSAGDWSTTYTCVPFYLTNTRRSVMLENSEYLAFDFTEDESVEVSVFASELRGRVLYGASLLDIVETFTEYTGRMEPLPDWSQTGSIVRLYGGTEVVEAAVAELEAADCPLAGVWIEDWCGLRTTPFGKRIWWNWVGDEALYSDWGGLIGSLKDRGVRVLSYFNPFLTDASEKENLTRNLFDEAEAEGYLVENPEGGSLLVENGGFYAGMIDLTNEATRSWIKEIMKAQISLGVSGWMADFGEALPYEAKLHSGVDSREYHNHYPYEWARLNREVIQEAGVEEDFLFFSRSGNAKSPGATRLFWIGDQLCSWDEYDGFQTVIPALLSSGLSGYSLQHTDTGGWLSVNIGNLVYTRSKELFQRWVELSAFTVLLRLHTTNDAEANHQYNTDVDTLEHFGRFSKIFALLAPYRATLMEEAQSKGYPLIRHLMLHYPEDEEVYGVSQQFLLGPEILVAPVVEEGAVAREVYFPAGKWVHIWTDSEYGDLNQGTSDTVDAPMGQPPVFYKKGSEVGQSLTAGLDAQGLR